MQTTHSVAFVTCTAVPDLSADDRLALPGLARRGIGVTPVSWDDPAVDWSAFDLVVIRSTWDYTRRYEEYRSWLARLERAAVPLWNPAALARWNADKRYLRDLAAAGVPVVPTCWVEPEEAVGLRDLLAAQGWARAVVKPVVSANGYDTWVTARMPGEADEQRFRTAAVRPLMVQPLMEEVRTEGEWSLVYFGGAFSHAVRKRPAGEEFRVQEEYGGRTVGASPSSDLVEAGHRALAAVPGAWLYARVDGVRVEDAFVLMELELLEPSFYFRQADPAARETFANAVLGLIEQGPRLAVMQR